MERSSNGTGRQGGKYVGAAGRAEAARAGRESTEAHCATIRFTERETTGTRQATELRVPAGVRLRMRHILINEVVPVLHF